MFCFFFLYSCYFCFPYFGPNTADRYFQLWNLNVGEISGLSKRIAGKIRSISSGNKSVTLISSKDDTSKMRNVWGKKPYSTNTNKPNILKITQLVS